MSRRSRILGMDATTFIFLIFVVWLLFFGGLSYIQGVIEQWQAPAVPGQPQPSPTPGAVHEAAAIQFSVVNYVTKASITAANTKVDIWKVAPDGTIDFLSKVQQVSVDSDPEQSTRTFAEGDTLILHVSSDVDPTGGTDHYDGWYYVTLRVGEPVRFFDPSLLEVVSTSPTYKYRFKPGVAGQPTGDVVQYTSGTTNYWGLGALYVYPRISAANLDAYLLYGGTVMASVTDGSSWVDTQAEQTADVTLASDDEKLIVKLDAGATNLCFGVPMITISSNGQLQKRVAVIIFATNATAIGTQKLFDKGWKQINDNTLTTEKAFYKVIPPQIPVSGSKWSLDIEIPIDASALSAGTAYSAKIWIIDFQLEDNVAIGSVSTTVPTAYGVGEYGLDSMIYPRAYSTSSGASTGMVLYGDWTTAS